MHTWEKGNISDASLEMIKCHVTVTLWSQMDPSYEDPGLSKDRSG
jgi:hypothetical protein